MVDNPVTTARISLWGKSVGAVSWMPDQGFAIFEYEPSFTNLGWNLSPIHMPLAQTVQDNRVFEFPQLNHQTYKGLPGLLADSLPDKFGNQVINAWLARMGRTEGSFSPVERLCYTGSRAMGALEFSPIINGGREKSVPVEIQHLVMLAQEITDARKDLDVALNGDKHDDDALLDILRVGTSAGGARPKAIIAMNSEGHVLSGQVDAPNDYDHWLLKFDGVNDLELGAPRSYGRIEYAYYLMALAAGVEMSECRLLEENGRAHFMTKRFDRQAGKKLHMQSLCGIAHYDFNQAGGYSYEQAFSVMRQLRLSKREAEQQFRRMLFNVLARNQDDHTKNIGFLMDEAGEWSLSPAYDMTYAHNPAGVWTSQHQMSVNGKRDEFVLDDFIQVGESISLKKTIVIVNEVQAAITEWRGFAEQAGLTGDQIDAIGVGHRNFIEK